MSKNTRTRILLTAVAALLLVVMTVGGTLAWLTDVTAPVTNTFSPADIHIKLEESNTPWSMQMIPGTSKSKDPTVTVDDALTSVDAYVYVKVEVSDKLDVLTWEIGEGWLELTGVDNVWYREWKNDDATTADSWEVLKGSTVSVSSDLTADDVYDATGSMVITAYAIQQEGFKDAADAWATGELAKMTAADDGNRDGNTDEGIAHATAEAAAVEYTPAP